MYKSKQVEKEAIANHTWKHTMEENIVQCDTGAETNKNQMW